MLDIQKSKLREKLLGFYSTRPGLSMYLRELARAIGADPANLGRELGRLEEQGIFSSEQKGNLKFFSLNKNYPFAKELGKIIAGTIGIESGLKKALADMAGIEFAFIFGSNASGRDRAESDVDLLIIGEAKFSALAERISRLEKEIGREINFRVFSAEDFHQAVREKNSFILNIIKNKKIFICGHEKDFGKIYQGKEDQKRGKHRL